MILFGNNNQLQGENQASISQAVETEQVALAYRHMNLSLVAVVVNVNILWWALADVVSPVLLTAWLIIQLVLTAIRAGTAIVYRRTSRSVLEENWKRIFFIGMLASAVAWGVFPLLLFPYESPLHQSILIIIFAGMSAGGTSSLSSVRYAPQIYLSILIIPLIFVLMTLSEPIYSIIGLVVTLYWALLMVVSGRIYQNVTNSIQSRILYEQALKELQISEERFETIFKEAPAGIFYYDTSLIVIETNVEIIKLLQISREQMMGLDMKALQDPCLDEALIAAISGKNGYYEGPYKTTINKLDLWISLRTSPIYDSERTIVGGVGIVTDITDRVIAEEKMKHQAYYDALTNIPNRMLLKDRIEQALAQYHRHKNLLAVMFLDLDHFKTINDSLGHHIGDELLIQTAERLQKICREGDTVSRLGGDEFIILLNELGTDEHISAKRAEVVAEKIHAALSLPFDVGLNEPITTSSSIGVVLVSSMDQNSDDLLKYADTAMYQAKKEGRNTTRFYHDQMDQWIKKRLFMENALRHAIKNRELELYYQPVIEIVSQKIIGAEALLRWNHPELGLIMPDEMIDIAEESGLIIPIGEWVIAEACKQFVSWAKIYPDSTLKRIAINVSVIQFRRNDFVEIMIQIVSESGINPSMLEIELTESTIIDNIDSAIEKMNQLRAFGIGISMDDFGTGYSSLGYLKRLPFSTLKIDRSFIRDIMSDKDDAALVETILSIATIFDLDVIAEGVETIEQFEFLKQRGCQYFQGYLCSKPVQVQLFEELLESNVRNCQSR